MVEKVRAEGAPVFVVDAGNLLWKGPAIRPEDRPQAEVKAGLQADALKLAGIDAMLPAQAELAFGVDWLKTLGGPDGLPWVAANLECGGQAPFPPVRTVEKGGVTLAFVGVLPAGALVAGCVAGDPVPAAKAAVASAKADAVVVLSAQKTDADERLAHEVPGVALVVNGAERKQLESASPLPGGALQLASGSRGKHLGVLRFTLTPGATTWRDEGARSVVAQRRDRHAKRVAELETKLAEAKDDKARERVEKQVAFYRKELAEADAELAALAAEGGAANLAKNELIDLAATIPDHPATASLVAKAKAAIDAATPVKGASVSALATGPFAGSASCTACHATEAAQWGATPHAKALASLEEAGRSRDRECFACHVTGAMHPAGPKDPGAVAGLENVGCEACHGPGKAHVARPADVDMTADPGEAGCTSCHDGERDGGRFVYPEYRPKVVH